MEVYAKTGLYMLSIAFRVWGWLNRPVGLPTHRANRSSSIAICEYFLWSPSMKGKEFPKGAVLTHCKCIAFTCKWRLSLVRACTDNQHSLGMVPESDTVSNKGSVVSGFPNNFWLPLLACTPKCIFFHVTWTWGLGAPKWSWWRLWRIIASNASQQALSKNLRWSSQLLTLCPFAWEATILTRNVSCKVGSLSSKEIRASPSAVILLPSYWAGPQSKARNNERAYGLTSATWFTLSPLAGRHQDFS